jgi:hypothetical protein
MAKINRYKFAVGYSHGVLKNTVVYAYSEKQARFFLYNQAKYFNKYLPCAELMDVTGTYPGDVVTMWNVEQQQFYDMVIR